MKLITFCLFILLATSIQKCISQDVTKQVKVEVFYETLNDVVRRFFVEQFRLVSVNLLDQIDLQLYPYGNTKSSNGKYECPYGDLQCEANKIHACIIKAETPNDATKPINKLGLSKFVNCFFKNRYADDNIESLGEKCHPNDVDSDWPSIRMCIQTDTDVTKHFENITKEIDSNAISDGFAIRINGNVNVAAKTNLAGEICNAIQKSDGICAQKEMPRKVQVGVYYESMNKESANYFISQLKPFYHVLEDFVDIELIPYGNTKYDSSSETYNCSMGDRQCISNKFQAIVVDSYINKPNNGDPVSGTNRAINFITCLAKSTIGNVFDALEICSNQNFKPDKYITILEAIKENPTEVQNILTQMRKKTEQFYTNNSLLRIPLITINGKIDYNAFDDLVQESCAQYKGIIKASICTKVKLTVLYEALNHKSRTLFLEQLKPIFENLYNLIDLTLIPAGRAVSAPGHGFVCPSGSDQCRAMQLHACALNFFWNDGNNYTDPIRKEIFDFIVCTFKNKRLKNVMEAAEICSNEHIETDAWYTIHGCLFDGTGNVIFEEYISQTGNLIENIAKHTIPIILFNDTTEITDLSNIKSLICNNFDDYHAPDYCESDMPSKVTIQIYYESMSDLSKQFFTTQYDPWYMYVEEMAQIELYPAGNVIETVNGNNGSCDSYNMDSVCLANKIQAFIIDRYYNHDDDGDFIDGSLRTMIFLSCAFNHPHFKDNVYATYEYCTENELIFDDWFAILVTVKSEIGSNVYKTVLDATDKFKKDNQLISLDPVPWVTLDNKMHSKRAADDLLQTVCQQYNGVKPLECTPVHVEIYYSAINPQSRRFFLDQLIPVFRNIRERIHLTLIPYGIANPKQTIEDECKTNENLCFANKVQACAINRYFKDEVIDNSIQWDGKNQTLAFITCMFKNIKNMDIGRLAEECANNNIILADTIMECAEQPEGHEYLSAMRNKTIELYESMEHVPWIVINGIRSAMAQSDLKESICDQMVGDHPNYCYEPTPAKVKVQFHYSSLDKHVQAYVLEELYPHYRLLEEIIDLDVVPFGLTEVLSQKDGNYTFICPHGIDECHVNLIHACLYNQYYHNDDDPISDNIEQYDGKLQFIEFLYCYFKNPNYPASVVDAATQCIEKIFTDDYSTIINCAHESIGQNILLKFQEEKVLTLLPHMTYVPWITVNGLHSYSMEHHIQRTVCDKYIGREKPHDCYQDYEQIDKPVVEIHYEPGDMKSNYFFSSSLIPEYIEMLAQVSFIPFGRSNYTNDEKKCVNDPSCVVYKEHACLIDLYMATHPIESMQSIACTFNMTDTGDNDDNALNKCVDQMFEDIIPDIWEKIHSCTLQKGEELMKQNALRVKDLDPPISHVPWLLINDEHNIEGEVNLSNELCSAYYPTDKPQMCKPKLQLVNIYYETMNDNVSNLISNQLSQYTEYLDEIGNFSFIPYGTTEHVDGKFICPRGDSQCSANRIHACMIDRFFNQTGKQITEEEYRKNRIRFSKFLVCTFFQEHSSSNPVEKANVCVDQNFEGDLWRDIHMCSAGPEGEDLYIEMGRQTDDLSPKLTNVPYVTIDSKQNLNASLNLFQAICNSYPIVKVPLCATMPSFAINVGIYITANEDARKFMIEQVLPFYKEIVPVLRNSLTYNNGGGGGGPNEAKLHALIKPTLVAWGDTKYDSSAKKDPFTCSGANECYINRFLACADYYHGDEPRSTLHLIEFALCFFSHENALTNGSQTVANECANRIWIPDPFPQLETCATEQSQDAYDIFLRMKNKTEKNNQHLQSFPAITINNKLNDEARTNLLKVEIGRASW